MWLASLTCVTQYRLLSQGISHGFTRALEEEQHAAAQQVQEKGNELQNGKKTTEDEGFLEQQNPTSLEMLHSRLLPPTSLGPTPWSSDPQPLAATDTDNDSAQKVEQRAFAALFESVNAKLPTGGKQDVQASTLLTSDLLDTSRPSLADIQVASSPPKCSIPNPADTNHVPAALSNIAQQLSSAQKISTAAASGGALPAAEENVVAKALLLLYIHKFQRMSLFRT